MVNLSKEHNLNKDIVVMQNHLDSIWYNMNYVEDLVDKLSSKYDLTEDAIDYFESWLERVNKHSRKFEDELNFFTDTVWATVFEEVDENA